MTVHNIARFGSPALTCVNYSQIDPQTGFDSALVVLTLLKQKNQHIAKALIPVKAKRFSPGDDGGVMNSAIDNLMNEHQLILQVLASFNSLASELRNGRSISRQDLADFVCFFREFADKCHHGKEEDRIGVGNTI
jgi:hypothetical protein